MVEIQLVRQHITGLRDQDLRTRLRAGSALVELGTSVIEPILACLGDTDSEVRWRLAAALGWLADAQAFDLLSRTVLTDESWEVRQNAAWAMGRIGDSRAVASLTGALDNDEDEQVRIISALALTQFEDGVHNLKARLHHQDEKVGRPSSAALSAVAHHLQVEI
jgi:HEAT repeat protein